MKIVVCVKQVPDTETKIKLSADNKSVDLSTVKWVMNPYDEYAVEEAIKTRDANPGSQIWVYTVGPKKRAGEVLRTALAMGADEAVLVDSTDFVDSLNTAKALAQAIKADGPVDLIFTGKLSIDSNASSVAQMLAEYLEVPHVSVVSKLTVQGSDIKAIRDADGGNKEHLSVKSPCLIAANKGLNMPRYASLPGIMKAKKKTIKEIDGATLGLNAASKNQTLSFDLPPEKPAVKMFSGAAGQQVSELVKCLRDEAKVL
jgi:electron transfer flavoprotein beta subunit